ncbi:phosphate/phosphite/phosphonate ABC transporter substrate-binding protein [Roseibium sp.]|uniref:phosphate/phosphite/phosphonate ABC transporter substrate-binding protein n=1 Tax=Roseibium sp. TaxID=1936156 RepID=UPI003D0FD439
MTPGQFRPVRLPMYDWPEVAEETRELEEALTDEICSVLSIASTRLDPWDPGVGLYDLWTDPALLLGQTCGYPLTHELAGKVHLLGAPNYKAPGCNGSRYCSQIVVAENSPFHALADLKGVRAVFNSPDSQSGMNALRDTIAPIAGGGGFFQSVSESGGHLASMDAVADGRADVAAIDAVCWALAQQEKPSLAKRLRVLAQTAQAPSLPFVTSVQLGGRAHEEVCAAVSRVLSNPQTKKSRKRLRICGFSKLVQDDYKIILEMETNARRWGYPVLT